MNDPCPRCPSYQRRRLCRKFCAYYSACVQKDVREGMLEMALDDINKYRKKWKYCRK